MKTFYGGIKFSEAGNNIAKPMVLRQIQDGKYNVVAPSWAFASRPLNWPRRRSRPLKRLRPGRPNVRTNGVAPGPDRWTGGDRLAVSRFLPTRRSGAWIRLCSITFRF